MFVAKVVLPRRTFLRGMHFLEKLGNGGLHKHTSLPLLTARKLGGQVKPGPHISYPGHTPISNLLLTVLDKAGVPVEKPGDTTGPSSPTTFRLSLRRIR